MEQAPKIRIQPQSQSPSPAVELKTEGQKCRPYQLIKINKQDLVDKFSRKIGHVSRLTHKSMCQAYNQALTDAEFLLMAAEKDTKNL